jgi:2-oxoisovalerate dehydrogenase E1 component
MAFLEQSPSAFFPSELPSLNLLQIMLLAREADRREAILFRQGQAKFQLPGAGHEALAAIAYALNPSDVIYPYYRDKALMLARGTSLHRLALDFFAKASSSSGGRQMASHYCDKDLNIVSSATPTGLQCLPAAGTAWGLKLSGSSNVVVCFIGDAATRQGEFYEGLCFALQEKLPIIYVVEDNGYGISTPTANMTPYNIGSLSEKHYIKIDGRDPVAVFNTGLHAIEKARGQGGPTILWAEVDRLMSHTSSDDQRIYRTKEELKAMEAHDPIKVLTSKLIAEQLIDFEIWEKTVEEIGQYVSDVYETASLEQNPTETTSHIFAGAKPKPAQTRLPPNHTCNMVEAVNFSLRHILANEHKAILFGEDISDPKGGVFGLTKGLSSTFPNQVFNSPLAEATICGVASGLSIAGHMPIFELQFIDFVGPAFNQIVNQIATLRWRTMGRYSCPLIIFAPCGGYIGCGGPWHSQTNEAWFTHAPGLKVCMPSTPSDTVDLFITASEGEDPVLILLPKNLFFKSYRPDDIVRLHPEQGYIRRRGTDLTILSWGNTVDIACEAAEAVEISNIHVEVVDIRCLSPYDPIVASESVAKTGRLIVLQEDNRTSSFGASLISELVSHLEIWKKLKAPPRLIAREDVHIGFHSDLEKLVLPQADKVVTVIHELMEML